MSTADVELRHGLSHDVAASSLPHENKTLVSQRELMLTKTEKGKFVNTSKL